MRAIQIGEFRDILKKLFVSKEVPWDKVKTIEIDWRRIDVGATGPVSGKYFCNHVAVPVLKIKMRSEAA